MKIYPSLMCADALHLADEIDCLHQLPIAGFHIDVMDGHFVPNLSLSPSLVKQIRAYTPLVLDVHLMTIPSNPWIQAFAEAGADHVTIHPESGPHPYRSLTLIRQLGRKVGLALNPGVSISTYAPLYDIVDFVLVMGVNPGFGGQSWIPQTRRTLFDLRQYRNKQELSFKIHMDGGINDDVISTLEGVDAVVVGNYLFAESSKDRLSLYKDRLNRLLQVRC